MPTSSFDQIHNDLNTLHEYYCSRRKHRGDELSIYNIWESGSSFDDSITPSAFNPEYRSHIALKIISITKENDRIFSIGCGNGFVEAELVKANRLVQAIDLHDEAVQLTTKKGVDAFTANFFDLNAGHLREFDVVYADGLLGHLFNSNTELDTFFDKLSSLGIRRGARLVISNDPPRDQDIDFAPHNKVDSFWFLSRQYLARSAARHGYRTQENYYYPYFRPISGLRDRSICISIADFGERE